ncbi:MAG: peptidase S41, partial [Myxococcales bacterium]|nr:peptidase S41 [Myxococcales bacterium]
LTIAQYLTPGDRSIQGVGVTPHVELDPMTVDPLEMDLTLQADGVRERDLSQHLSNDRAQAPTKPAQVLRYYLSEKDRTELRERGGELDDDFEEDFPITFARDLAKRLPSGKGAADQLRQATAFIEEARNKQLNVVTKELGKLDVDWSLPQGGGSAGPTKDDLAVEVSTDKPGDKVKAGESMNLSVKVTNNGDKPVYRLRAVTESDNPYFDEKELVFGKIAPGKTRSATVPLSWCEIDEEHETEGAETERRCRVPMDALSRADGVRIHFDAAGGHTPASAEIRPTIEALPRPLFQYSYQIVDDAQGNGDGLVQRGERVSVYLTVKNVGVGRSYDSQANLANRSGDGVLLRKGRFDISNMAPGDVRKVAFTFDVEPQLKDDEVVLSLSVGDRDLREFASEKIKIPVVGAVSVAKKEGIVTTTAEASLFPDVSGRGEPFGLLKAGVGLERLGERGTMTKVKLGEERFAFVETAKLKDGGSARSEISYSPIYSHAPPKLEVKAAAMATRSDKVKLTVEASDSERLLDMYVFVGSRKLHYQSNRDGADPTRASFVFDAPLQEGVNVITVVARETPDTTTRRVVVVRRDGADGTILKTPKRQDDDFLLEALDGP